MSSNFHPDGTLFIVSGPSGAGKTTLINRVRDQLDLHRESCRQLVDADGGAGMAASIAKDLDECIGGAVCDRA